MMRSRNVCLLILISLVVACGSNPHTPRGNSVGADRIDESNRAAEWLLAHTKDGKRTEDLPRGLLPKGALKYCVGKQKVVAFEFPSEPIDLNPVYIFVAADVPDPENAIKELLDENPSWHGTKKLEEPGWYLAHGI
jgi:hypothetical protein